MVARTRHRSFVRGLLPATINKFAASDLVGGDGDQPPAARNVADCNLMRRLINKFCAACPADWKEFSITSSRQGQLRRFAIFPTADAMTVMVERNDPAQLKMELRRSEPRAQFSRYLECRPRSFIWNRTPMTARGCRGQSGVWHQHKNIDPVAK